MTIGIDPLATYPFTGTNGTTPPATGTTVIDSNSPAAQIQSNKCQFTGNYSANPNLLQFLTKAQQGAAPVRVSTIISQIVIYQGVLYISSGSWASGLNGYFVYLDGGTVNIDRYVAGVGTNILSSYWGLDYFTSAPTTRFDYDDSSGSPVFSVSCSVDGYSNVKTVTDTDAAKIVGKMDLQYYNSDDPGVTSTIDDLTVVGTAVASGIATNFKSSSKLTNVLSTSIPLAASLTSVAKFVSALAATSVFATLLAAKPTIIPTLATSFNLATTVQSAAKLSNALTNWTTVTLAGTLFNGNGSAISPYLWTTGPAPTVGTTLYYDSTYITIYTDAQTSSSVGTAVTLIQWFDGTQWWSAELAYTPGEVTFFGAKSSLVNDLTTSSSMSSSLNATAKLTNNLNTTISLASLNKSIASLPNALSSGITFASALNSVSSMPNVLATSISVQTLLSSKSSLSGSFSLLLNATLSSASKLTNNLSTSIPLQTLFAANSSVTSVFALPDMALQSVLRTAVSMPNALGTGIALQTNEMSNSRLLTAMSSGISLATVLDSTLGFSSTLGGAAAVFQTTLATKAALLSDLYAYKAITTTLASSSTVVSSLGTTLSLQCAFSSTSSLLSNLIVLPVELPPTWRCVSIGSATHDAINGQALPDKDPEDVLDYGIILSDEAVELDPLKVLSVSVESCSPDESPMLLVIDNALWAMSNPTSGVIDSIVFWLSGGTVGTTYVLRIEADDTETAPHMRVLVRRVTITVAKQ